jgi:hypothetical protein
MSISVIWGADDSMVPKIFIWSHTEVSALEGHWPEVGGGIFGKNVLEGGPVVLSTCAGG